jgi:hypothetical protein
MTDYRNSKWAAEIIELQKDDGSWGYFHTLSNPSKRNKITTEQAIRRLEILGYTINDKPIAKVVSYMQDCLTGKKELPDRREKVHNWDIFTSLMLSTWIHRFTKDDHAANYVAEKWAEIISHAFKKGIYDHDIYVDTYKKVFVLKPKGGRLLDFANFYHISLLSDSLADKTASACLTIFFGINQASITFTTNNYPYCRKTLNQKKQAGIFLLLNYYQSIAYFKLKITAFKSGSFFIDLTAIIHKFIYRPES